MRDAVVIGGGPVGLFAAAVLAERGLDVIVWEKRLTDALSSRAIGIHPPSLEAFARIGIADEVVDQAVAIRRGLARSAGHTLGAVSFASVSGAFPFVASLPQFQTEDVVQRRLEKLAPGALRRGIELKGIDDVDPDQVRLHGRGPDGDVFETARYVVGADGARSAVRHLLGIKTSLKAYPDPFVMGDFRDDSADGDDAVVHLEDDGMVESFPLPGGKRRFVVNAGGASLPGRPSASSVADLVTARTGVPVDPSTNTMVSAFVTRRRFAESFVHGRTVLVGDAAHEISPIGGQGMNLGWLDVADLAPIVTAGATRQGVDVAALNAYEERRMRIARRAARQAEANMAMGRPASGFRRGARNRGFGILLSSPAGAVLARTYAMAWT